MKKIILGMVFVFGMITMTNANEIKTSELEVATDCIGLAFALEEIFGEMDYETFSKVVDKCESMQ